MREERTTQSSYRHALRCLEHELSRFVMKVNFHESQSDLRPFEEGATAVNMACIIGYTQTDALEPECESALGAVQFR